MINSISSYLSKGIGHQENVSIRIRSVVFMVIAFTTLLHIPFAFASGNSAIRKTDIHANPNKPARNEAVFAVNRLDNNAIAFAYDSMNLDEMGLSEQAFNYAMKGFNYLLQQGRLAKDNIISIVDFSLPSSRKRLYVIDLKNYRVLFNTYVAHGVNSGKEYASQFSNQSSSYKSSLGFYETLSTYNGQHGYSLKLDGLEKGINDNANSRAIVIHAAGYVDESLIRAQGFIGRSWGCPALPEKLHKPIIDIIRNGSCLFIYSNDNAYLKSSRIINAVT